MKKFAQKLIYCFLLFIQVGLIIAVFVVNDLSAKKAGVYRHVYTKRIQYLEGLFNPTSIQWQSLLVVGLCILLIILLFFSIKKGRGLFYKVQIVLAILLGFFVNIVMYNEFFILMMAYPYIMMIFEIVFVIQVTVVIALGLKKSKQ